ncbi:MAG: AMP-binding protein [Verrucomicrobiota bacterium]|jgi:acyl-[acyl-carrier-protein]-phospholipid O-acyltransferase/long-chain-fatty-acid--[acyl-carrier-protein] ligase
MKRILRFFLWLLFGFRASNTAALETPGPVMLLPNHVSWLDWLFLASCLDTRWRFVTSTRAAQVSFVHRFIMLNRFTFPVDPDSPYAVKRMAEFLQTGGKLVLFPEGRLSRTGSLMKLFDGTGFLLFKTGAKVITCYLRGASRLPFSPNPNRKKCLPRVTAHFSGLLTPQPQPGLSTTRARQKLTRWLYDTMVQQQFDTELAATPKNVLAAVVETARQFPGTLALEDALHTQLTYRRLLADAGAMSRRWRAQWPGDNRARIGVLLPTSVAMPLTLFSLWAAEKIPAILNFSTGIATMLACAQLAGLKQIITSKAFLERARLNVQPMIDAGIEFIYLEEVRAKIPRRRKLQSLLRVCLAPGSMVPAPRSDVAVVLFTSGSEGTPKGVELTHTNLLANVRQLLAVFDVTDSDRLFDALPLFHSFGLIGMLVSLIRGCYVFLYPSPLHYRVIPTLIYDLDCTVFFTTNTFLNGYARKANPFDFRTLRLLVSAAEKLQETTANTWARQFGARILEGYGATECSPCVTINSPINPRFGTAGKFLPGMACKFEPVEGVPDGGRLWVRGPNIMRGYLNPEANQKFLAAAGWYDTGDVACLDGDGFLQILGRLKRFAKVSGEMVSLTAAEEALAGAFPQYGLRFQIAVLARPDPDRGESLVAVANDQRLSMEELRAAIKASGLSNLYRPREIKYARDIPKLGTGKVDHLRLQTLLP